MTHASPPKHEQFITFTPSAGEDDDTTEVPALALNPRAIASISLSDDDTTICIHLLTGAEHRITGLLKPRVRGVYRDLLRGLGEKNSVTLPVEAQITSGKDLA